MATNNPINVALIGDSGTGKFILSNSPVIVTPTLGNATATSISFTTNSEIIGNTANTNAPTGSVGEFIISSILSSSAVALTAGTVALLTVSLTAGDWDCFGNVFIVPTLTGTTGVFSQITTSASIGNASLCNYNHFLADGNALGTFGFTVSSTRISLSGTTTVNLLTELVGGSASATGCGNLVARRIR